MKSFQIDLREDGKAYAQASLFENDIATGIKKKRPAIIVIPGGCYLYKSHREGDPVAARFQGMGYHTFVYQYLSYWKKKYLSPDEKIEINEEAHYPIQVLDLYKLITKIRENADDWGVDPNQIYVLGFSAGGHIAAAAASIYLDDAIKQLLEKEGCRVEEAQIRPDGAILCYPMLDAEIARHRSSIPEQFRLQAPYLMQAVFGQDNPAEETVEALRLRNHIHSEMPPVFIWHTSQDRVTSPIESALYAARCIEKGVPVEFHLFEQGHHGMSLCDWSSARDAMDQNEDNAIWPELADHFLKRHVN